MQELGSIELSFNDCAAIGISDWVGSGKIRHIEVTQLWLQEKAGSGAVKVRNEGAEENLADAFTKGVGTATIATNVAGVELHDDYNEIAPAFERSAPVEVELEGEWGIRSELTQSEGRRSGNLLHASIFELSSFCNHSKGAR